MACTDAGQQSPWALCLTGDESVWKKKTSLQRSAAHLGRQKETSCVRAVQAKKAADIVHELEDVDVLAVLLVNEVWIGPSHSCKDCGHHDEGEDCQSAAPNPAVVHCVGCSIVPHQLHDQNTDERCFVSRVMTVNCHAATAASCALAVFVALTCAADFTKQL